jgi:hypothetical protein
MNKLIIHKDKVYKAIESPFYNGYEPVDISEDEPTLAWKGGKIPIAVWHEVLSFFKWSYDETKSETQVRLLYHPEKNQWVAWAFPQEHGTGMTAKEIDGEEKDKQRSKFAGYTACGTVHHHCSAGAFQSSVDHNNEINQDGIHLTVGHMDKDEYDLDARVCRKGVMYGCNLGEWFDYPDKWNGVIPAKYISPALEEQLVTPPSESSFPDEWKSNLIKVQRNPVTNYSYSHNRRGRVGFQNSYSNTTPWLNSQTNLDLPIDYTDKEKMDAVREFVAIATDEKEPMHFSIDELQGAYIYAACPEFLDQFSKLITKFDISEQELGDMIDEIENQRLDDEALELDKKYNNNEPINHWSINDQY